VPASLCLLAAVIARRAPVAILVISSAAPVLYFLVLFIGRGSPDVLLPPDGAHPGDRRRTVSFSVW
jgi:hypothetical protein